MTVNRELLRERIQYHVFDKEFLSRHFSGRDFDMFVSCAMPLFGEDLGGMRYGVWDPFAKRGEYPTVSAAGTEATSLQIGMTRKYTGDLRPRKWLEENGHVTPEESRRADFLGAKMVIRDKNRERAEMVKIRPDELEGKDYPKEVQDLFELAGRFVESISVPSPGNPDWPLLERFYNTAPDSRTNPLKMTYVGRRTEKVHCLPEEAPYFGSGDPSVVTAMGIVGAIKAVREQHFPSDNRLQIGILGGAGSVGSSLIELLRKYEASGYLGFNVDLKASDIDDERVQSRLLRIRDESGVEIVPMNTEHLDAHVWSVNGRIKDVRLKKVQGLRRRTALVGAENEQLPENPFDKNDPGVLKEVWEIYDTLRQREGYYSPDFVNNNGGIHDVNCRVMFEKEGYSKQRAMETMLLAGQFYVTAVYQEVQRRQQEDKRELVQSHLVAQDMALDALVDRIIERRDEVLRGPFAAYFAEAL